MKKLLYLVLGIAAIFIIAAISFILLFDPNDYREDISAEVQRATGREFVIEGDIGLSLFPWLAIDVGRTRLGNAPGFGDTPFATFDRARLSVRLLPMLLRREVSVGTASLEGLQLNLAVDRNGRGNWEDLAEAGQSEAAAAEPAETATRALDIAGIEILAASVTYADAQLGETYTLTDMELSTGPIAAGNPVSFSSNFDFDLQPADLAGEFAIEAVMTLYTDAGTVAFSGVEMSVAGIDVRADVEPFSYEGDLAPVATFEVDAFSLKSLMRSLGMEAIETADPDALGKVIVDGTARVGAAAIRIADLNLVVDDTTFAGEVSLARDAAGTITVNLAGDSMDLDRYMAPAGDGEGSGQEAVPVEIPAELIRSLNVRGNLALDTALLAGMTFTNAKLGINAANGRLRMHPITAEFFDGTYEGDVRIDASGAAPALSVNERVRAVNVGSLAKAMFEREDISGSINGTFQLTGSGADLSKVQRSLSGSLSFELIDGAWEGTDLWYELRRARAMLRKEPAPEPQLPARTPFSSVRISGPVQGGVFKSDDLLADLPFMQLTGKGSVDLAAAEVDYRLSVRVLERPEFLQDASAEELEDFTKTVIPVRVTGPLAAPSIKPDVESMLRQEAEKKVKKKIEDKLKDLLKR